MSENKGFKEFKISGLVMVIVMIIGLGLTGVTLLVALNLFMATVGAQICSALSIKVYREQVRLRSEWVRCFFGLSLLTALGSLAVLMMWSYRFFTSKLFVWTEGVNVWTLIGTCWVIELLVLAIYWRMFAWAGFQQCCVKRYAKAYQLVEERRQRRADREAREYAEMYETRTTISAADIAAVLWHFQEASKVRGCIRYTATIPAKPREVLRSDRTKDLVAVSLSPQHTRPIGQLIDRRKTIDFAEGRRRHQQPHSQSARRQQPRRAAAR